MNAIAGPSPGSLTVLGAKRACHRSVPDMETRMKNPSWLLLSISCLVICACSAPTNQSTPADRRSPDAEKASSATVNRQRIRLYVSKLSDNSQAYYYSADADEAPPPGYSASTNTPGLESGDFDAAATPQPGMVPVYSFTIAAKGGTLVYYLSTNKEVPPGFSAGKIQFYVYLTQRPGTIPVYLHTIVPNDLQLYYYSTSAAAPPGFRTQGGPTFYVFPAK